MVNEERLRGFELLRGGDWDHQLSWYTLRDAILNLATAMDDFSAGKRELK